MRKISPSIHLLRLVGVLLPGNYLKTTWYLYFIAKPRKIIRQVLNGFYRIEHIYDVIREAKRNYSGNFTILEFGTNKGYALVKMLYATHYLGMKNRIKVHGFDTFEGMPDTDALHDKNIVFNDDEWVTGQFEGNYEALNTYCAKRYSNYELHKGLFENTLTDEFLQTLKNELPILVWIDCDYYSSASVALQRLIPYLPTGCVVYFDEFELNFGSTFTGEAKLVHEINNGKFGDDIELLLDSSLSLDSKRVYRFVRFESGKHYERLHKIEGIDHGRGPSNESLLP